MTHVPAPSYIVAIPARNEAERIATCLAALDAQQGARFTDIVLLINNSCDETAAIARAVPLHPATRLHVIEHHFPPADAHAGNARKLAMDFACRLAGASGILLTTDADSRVDPNWLAENLSALHQGAELVAGWVELEPAEHAAIPARLHQDEARIEAYDALCDEIHARIDPDPDDPLPRHTQHSGASLAMTVGAYKRCGGVPPLPCGEDRALVDALRQVDAPIRHALSVHVIVSGRLIGRSPGGMADTIRRRLTTPDTLLDPRLEPATDCARRAWARHALRRCWNADPSAALPLMHSLGMPPEAVQHIAGFSYFGQAWHYVETSSPALRRNAVPVSDLENQIGYATAIVMHLRLGEVYTPDQALAAHAIAETVA